MTHSHEIVSNSSSKISFVSVSVKEISFLHCFSIMIFWQGVKNCNVKNEKGIVFPKSQNVKLNPDKYTSFASIQLTLHRLIG